MLFSYGCRRSESKSKLRLIERAKLVSRLSYEHEFCHILLKDTMAEVRRHYTQEQIKSAWVRKAGRNQFEFHLGSHCDHFSACCADAARSRGWERLMRQGYDEDCA